MNSVYHRPPQRDVPTEVIVHYIVKDYQRMFLTYDEMKARAEKAETKIKDLSEKHASQLSKRDKEIEQLKQDLEAKSKEKIKDLEEKLIAAQQQNRLLAKAVIAQNSGEDAKVLFQGMLPADAKQLEKKLEVQLGDAIIKLTAAEERLTFYQEQIENNTIPDVDAISMKSFLAKITRAFGKIDSATQHIENFYKLANGIPLL